MIAAADGENRRKITGGNPRRGTRCFTAQKNGKIAIFKSKAGVSVSRNIPPFCLKRPFRSIFKKTSIAGGFRLFYRRAADRRFAADDLKKAAAEPAGGDEHRFRSGFEIERLAAMRALDESPKRRSFQLCVSGLFAHKVTLPPENCIQRLLSLRRIKIVLKLPPGIRFLSRRSDGRKNTGRAFFLPARIPGRQLLQLSGGFCRDSINTADCPGSAITERSFRIYSYCKCPKIVSIL